MPAPRELVRAGAAVELMRRLLRRRFWLWLMDASNRVYLYAVEKVGAHSEWGAGEDLSDDGDCPF